MRFMLPSVLVNEVWRRKCVVVQEEKNFSSGYQDARIAR
jgi:hypothetical protein